MEKDPKQAIKDMVAKVEEALPKLTSVYGEGDPRVVLARLYLNSLNGHGGPTLDVLAHCNQVTGPIRLAEGILQWVPAK